MQIDNGHDTDQVKSELSSLPYQSTTEVVKTTQRRNRAHAVDVHYYDY